ncbi:phage tail assembly chaperone [Pseudomonas sp. KnCO4]|uniref:phage tail assembly chaperone n=1 Tax=Pseudomonas sp. KnCO4 TaxID=3381355 RepID=UPI003878129D
MEIQIFASKSTRGFYEVDESSNIPSDAVEVSAELRTELLEGERSGKVIAWGEDGIPFLVEPPLPTSEELAVIERRWRDERLLASDGLVTRHRDERDIGVVTTLSEKQFSELLEYRQSLRNWPQADAFPTFTQSRPSAPDWLVQFTQ